MPFPGDRSPAEIAGDIERTRAEIGRTLGVLEHKLGSRQLVEKGVDMVSEAIKEYDLLNRGIDAVRANPLPVTLIGVGATWLLLRAAGWTARGDGDAAVSNARHAAPRNPALPPEPRLTQSEVLTPGVAERHGTAEGPPSMAHARNRAADGDDARDRDGWVHHAADQARGALRTVRDSGGTAIDHAGSYYEQGRGEATRIADQLKDTFERHPLLLGSIGAVAGALVAAALPATAAEDRCLGAAGDRMRISVGEAGRDALVTIGDVVKRSADAAADAAYEVARDATDRAAPAADRR